MLQSSNQYLRPDYMAAPNAIDTKSSPLALLAQTCSAIGADTTNPKLLAANIEKSTKSLKSSDGRDKTSPVSSHSSSVSTGSVENQQVKSSFKPYESNNNNIRERLEPDTEHSALSSSGGIGHSGKLQRSNISLQNGQQQRSDSNQSATSQRESPATVTTLNGLRRTPNNVQQTADIQTRINSPQRTSSKDSSASNITPVTQTSPNMVPTRLSASEPSFAVAKEASYVKALHAAATAAGIPSTNATYYSGYPNTPSMPYSMDLMTASALMSSHHPMFKAAALNPYLNYARLKGIDPSTAAALMTPNICRDPFCTGCASSPHFLNKAAGQPCPAGCPQCESMSGANKSMGPVGGSASAVAAAASSYHAQLAALAAASQMPYVCSWIGSDAVYCGKRFGTSDELFQHLRTHTASLPDSVLSAAAAGGIPPNHPLFQKAYPTPPLSPLSAARYHPYGKPSMLPPSLAPPGSLASLPMTHPALAQYFAPYSLYGPRMGSSHP